MCVMLKACAAGDRVSSIRSEIGPNIDITALTVPGASNSHLAVSLYQVSLKAVLLRCYAVGIGCGQQVAHALKGRHGERRRNAQSCARRFSLVRASYLSLNVCLNPSSGCASLHAHPLPSLCTSHNITLFILEWQRQCINSTGQPMGDGTGALLWSGSRH